MAKMKGLAVTVLLIALIVTAGCASKGQTGALAGSGIGALAGQLIGGNTAGTLIGAAVGAGLGYVIGNEMDKSAAKQKSDQTEAKDYYHDETGPLGGTKWELVDWAPRKEDKHFKSKTVEFLDYGYVVTRTILPDNTIREDRESYRVVGDTLIVNRPGYLTNYRFFIQEDQMTIDTPEVRAMLKRK